MFHRTNKKCWKCGQDVGHQRYRLGKPELEPGPKWRVRLCAWWRARLVRISQGKSANRSSTALRREEQGLHRVPRVREAGMNIFQRQLLIEGKSLAELPDLEGRRQPLDYYGSSAGVQVCAELYRLVPAIEMLNVGVPLSAWQ